MKNIFVLGCLMLSVVSFGQTISDTTASPSTESILLVKNNYRDIFQRNFDFGPTGLSTSYPSLTAAPIHLSNPFMSGMFCKMEYKLESKSGLAPRFRLGSLNYTEWMEGKKEIYMRYWK